MTSKENVFITLLLDLTNTNPKTPLLHAQIIGCLTNLLYITEELFNYSGDIDHSLTTKLIKHKQLAINLTNTIRTLLIKHLIEKQPCDDIDISKTNPTITFNKYLKRQTLTIRRNKLDHIHMLCYDILLLIFINTKAEINRFKICPHCTNLFYQFNRRSQKYCSINCSNSGRYNKKSSK